MMAQEAVTMATRCRTPIQHVIAMRNNDGKWNKKTKQWEFPDGSTVRFVRKNYNYVPDYGMQTGD